MKLILLIASLLLLAAPLLQANSGLPNEAPTSLPFSAESSAAENYQYYLAADDGANDKRCMMVCEEWGQDCVVNQQTGEQDCRKVCVKFGEQCF